MTSASDKKWRPFNYSFSRVGLRTYQHHCKMVHNNAYMVHLCRRQQCKLYGPSSKEIIFQLVYTLFISHPQNLLWNENCPFAYGLLQTNSSAKQIVMTDKSLRSFHISVSFGVKQSTISEGINRLWSSNVKYRVIHKSLRDFLNRLRNNQDRHDRKEHINR